MRDVYWVTVINIAFTFENGLAVRNTCIVLFKFFGTLSRRFYKVFLQEPSPTSIPFPPRLPLATKALYYIIGQSTLKIKCESQKKKKMSRG